MAKLTLADLASLTNESSAISTINANSALIETALENTLSRDGTSPNSMSAQLDMNSNRVINLGSPLLNSDAARYLDIVNAVTSGGGSIALNGGYWGGFSDIASASTVDLGNTVPMYLNITGTTTITSFGTAVNRFRVVKFASVLTLTHNSTSLVLPDSVNIKTKAGDIAIFVSDESGNWRCINYQRQTTNSPSFNVKDYGAVGDGSTDDTTAIQSAITACGTAGGGVVYFPKGSYKTTSTLTVSSDSVKLRGDHSDSAVIYRTHNSGYTISFTKGTSTVLSGVGISGIAFLNNGTMTVGSSPYHLNFDNVTRFDIRDIIIHSGAGGMRMAACSQGWVDRLFFAFLDGGASTSRYGIRIVESSIATPSWGGDMFFSNIDIWGGTVSGTTITASIDYGWAIEAQDGIWLDHVHCFNTAVANYRVRNNTVGVTLSSIYANNVMSDHCLGYGLLMDGSQLVSKMRWDGQFSSLGWGSSGYHGIAITSPTEHIELDVSVEGHKGSGIYIDNAAASNITIRPGSFYNNDAGNTGAGGGIWVQQAVRVDISGGVIGGENKQDFGIRLGSQANKVTVAGVTISDVEGSAVKIDSGATNFTLSGITCISSGASVDNSGAVTKKIKGVTDLDDYPALTAPEGGTGFSSYAIGDTLYASSTTALSKLSGNTTTTRKFLRQTGNGTASAAPAWDTIVAADVPGSALTKTDDTNVTLTLGGSPTTALLNAASLTLGWTGQLAASRGGTGVSSFGGTNTLLYTTSTSTLSSLATANNGVLITSAGGVPSISSTLPNAVQDNITRLGTVTSGTWNAGSVTSSSFIISSQGGVQTRGSSGAFYIFSRKVGEETLPGVAWYSPAVGSMGLYDYSVTAPVIQLKQGKWLNLYPSGGIGYGPGAGDTVTQATNKSTGVTLNKICGQITMNNAALASGASVSFTLTNSTIEASDVVIAVVGGGYATAGTYLTNVLTVAAGSCVIRLVNVSGGSLSEAVVINYAVIKSTSNNTAPTDAS